MLISISIVILMGLLMGRLMQKVSLPSLMGYLLTGIVLGPDVLNLLSGSFLDSAADFRQLALIIILTRAGLSLDIADLKKVGCPALLMCFVPATVEILAVTAFAPVLLGFSLNEGLLLGSIIAAVSPAVVVPRMLKISEEGYGAKKKIPAIVLAGASVDDVFVLVLFAAFLGLNQGAAFSAATLFQIPVAILSGLVVGGVLGWLLSKVFTMLHLRDSLKVLLMLSVSFLLMGLEDALSGAISFSGMLSVMSMCLLIFKFVPQTAQRLSGKFNKLWLAAEIFLFVLVGSSVSIRFAFSAGWLPLLLILVVSAVRMIGVWLALLGTGLTFKERLFCMISYLPKATVQAAIGGIPLAMGVHNGEMMLTVAVLSILLTAPIGALAVDRWYKKLLTKDE